MLIAMEVTAWNESFDCNHLYLFNDSMTKAYAYVRNRDLHLHVFKNPMVINTKGRKFEILERIKEEDPDRIEVEGSNGNVYYVTKVDDGYKCTCTGFKYHGTCKHIEKVMNEISNA